MNKIKIEQLEELEIFKNISKDSLDKLAHFGEVKKYTAGSHIFRDKEDVTTFYIVVSGGVSLYKLNESGHKKCVIFILGTGKMINDAIIQDLPASINCEIFEEAQILSYDKHIFLDIWKRILFFLKT